MSDDRIGEVVPAGELVQRLAGLGLNLDEGAIERMDAAGREAAAAREAREARESIEARNARLVSYGMPTRDLESMTMATLDDGDAKRAIDRFVERHSALRKQHVLVISGAPGSGKTCAAAYWLTLRGAKHPHVATREPLFMTAAKIARTSSFDDTKLERIELAEKLVIDDLGVEYADDKGALASKLDMIIDARYEHLLPTVITTNLDAQRFKSRVGARIVSRLEETGHFASVTGAYRKRA